MKLELSVGMVVETKSEGNSIIIHDPTVNG